MKLSLAAKILVGFTVLIATVALLAFFFMREMGAVIEDLHNIRDGHLTLARKTAQLETQRQNRFRDLHRALEEIDPGNQQLILHIANAYFPDVIHSTVEETRAICAKQIAEAAAHGGPDRESRLKFYRDIMQRIDRIAERHEALDEITRTAVMRGEPITEYASKINELEGTLHSDGFQLNKYIDDETDRAVHRAEQDERFAIWRVVVMTAIALFIGLVLTFLSQRALAPIARLVHYARAISRGDYEQPVEVHGVDELASLAEELRQMARSRKEREAALDRQAGELETAYRRVAELKRYHESVVRSLRTAVVVTDRELVVTSVNRAAETHWGLPADVRGKKLGELSIGPPLIGEIGPLSRLLEKAETVDVKALLLGELHADVTIAPFQNERGDVLGLVLAMEDVTDAIRTKEALIRSERLAAIGRMSAHVTHEIRNPLSSIGLNAEMLEQLVTEEDAGTLCRAIVREVDRLSAITDEYLRFARLPRPVLEPEAVGALLSAIGGFMRRDLEAAKVSLELAIAPDLPPLYLDADQMRQAIMNLVRNGKESMPQGGKLVLSASRVDGTVVIGVRDSGFGIPKESLERIFDPFFSTKLTGTGLGLALTQQIVAEHGGTLQVDSTVGAGSEFRIVMPIGPVDAIVFESRAAG